METTTDTEAEVEYDIADEDRSCFASLADRNTRRGIDPGPLAEHGIVSALQVGNSGGQQQATIPQEDFPRFLFQSNRGTKHIITAEMALGLELAAGWASLAGGSGPTGLGGKQEMYQRYFQVEQAQSRQLTVTRLATIVHIERCCAAQGNKRAETSCRSHQHWGQCVRCELLRSSLNEFRIHLGGDSTLTALELLSSSLVQALHRLLSPSGLDDYIQETPRGSRLLLQRIAIFKENFQSDFRHGQYQQNSTLHFRHEPRLTDRIGRTLKTEPLTSVGKLKEKYLLEMVAKQWLDYGRSTRDVSGVSISGSQPVVTIGKASQAAAAAAVEAIVVDDSLMAIVADEMMGINAYNLLVSLERQASQLQAEAETIALAQQQQSSTEPDEEDYDVDGDPADSPPQAKAVGNAPTVRQATSMSVSVPNLCASTSESREERETTGGATPAAILKSFANVARRRHKTGTTVSSSRRGGPSILSGRGSSQARGGSANRSGGESNTSAMGAGAGSGPGSSPFKSGCNSSINASSILFPRDPNPVSSLVRLALSNNFTGGLLSIAQSYPSRSNALGSSSASDQASCTSSDSTGVGVSGLSQAISSSLTTSYLEQRKFSALIPAFDSRSKKTNVNQTSELEIPPPGPLGEEVTGAEAIIPKAASPAIVSPVASSTTTEADLVPQPFHLTLRCPSITNVRDVEVEDSFLFCVISGVFVAKALQDGRLVDVPLSASFVKLRQGGVSCPVYVISDSQKRNNKTCYPHAGSAPTQQRQHLTPTQPPSDTEDDPMTSSVLSQEGDCLRGSSKPGSSLDPSQPWFSGYLSHEDLPMMDTTASARNQSALFRATIF